MYVPGVTTNVTTLTLDAAQKQNLPVVVLAEKEGVVLVRKEKIYDCEETLYRTNHPTIYLSKKKLQRTLTSNNLATLATYFNDKIDFVVVSLHEQMKMINYTLVNRMYHLHNETLRNKIAIAIKHPD